MVLSLIENHRIHIAFQPIVSIRSSKVIGIEALMRANDENNEPLSPIFVFDQAQKEHLSLELDNYVRSLALEAFSHYLAIDPSLLLFLNFEPLLS